MKVQMPSKDQLEADYLAEKSCNTGEALCHECHLIADGKEVKND